MFDVSNFPPLSLDHNCFEFDQVENLLKLMSVVSPPVICQYAEFWILNIKFYLKLVVWFFQLPKNQFKTEREKLVLFVQVFFYDQ